MLPFVGKEFRDLCGSAQECATVAPDAVGCVRESYLFCITEGTG